MADQQQMTASEKRNKEMAMSAWTLLQGMKKAIGAVIPKHLTPERMATIAFTAMKKTPKLMECTADSIVGSIMTASMLGLEPSGPLGHGALIPYGKECQFQPMYQGLLDLARRSGFVKDVQCRAVYVGDTYSYRFGLEPDLIHVPMEGEGADDPDRVCTHVYAIIRLNGGGTQWDQMSIAQAMGHAKRFSPSWNTRDYPNKFKPGSPWAEHPIAMAQKTVLKMVLKLCPKSPELAAAVSLDDAADRGKTVTMTNQDGIFDVDFGEEPPKRNEREKGTVSADDLKPGQEQNRGHGNENLGSVGPSAEKGGSGNSAGGAGGASANPGDAAPKASETKAAKAGTKPAASETTGGNGGAAAAVDETRCTEDDFFDLETSVFDHGGVAMVDVRKYVKDQMGVALFSKLPKSRLKELYDWIASHAKKGAE